ncbi:MAG: hypothetical protein OQL06_14820 [Gammaproteobacteria bacterium]|nr:hypothetical protein [Gammaproteobacteria bacterium]
MRNYIRLGTVLVLAGYISVMAWGVSAADLPASALPGAVDPGRESRPEFTEPPAEVFMVPPLISRPLGVDEGERLFVKSIVLRGAIDRPEAGIRLQEVRELVEGLRFKSQKLDSEVTSGFTKEELEYGAEFLRKLIDDPEKFEISKEFIVEQLVSDLRFKMKERWLTIGHLQRIADEVSLYYRRKGFILAQVYLPAQEVRDGEVVLQIMEGIIGNITVENNRRYSEALIKEPFVESMGQPAYKNSIESSLLQLSDYPGLSVYGVFRPGEEVGSTELWLNVREEKFYEIDLQLDNHGSDYTGKYRPQLSYTYNNLSRAADSINLRLMHNYKPDNSVYWSLEYQRPVFNRHNKIIAEASHNAFDLGASLADFNMDGTSDNASLAWQHTFIRSRTKNAYGTFRLTQKKAELSEPLMSLDELAIASLEYGYDAFDFRFSGVNIAWIKYSQGLSGLLGAMEAESAPLSSRQTSAGVNVGSEFGRLEVRYDRLQTLSTNQSLLLSLYGQYSGDLLTSTEQMPIGGPGSVRAYPASEYLMDKGYFASVEWIIKAPGIVDKPVFGSTWGQVLQLVLFADAAGGRLNDPLLNEVGKISVSGAGIGARIKVKNFSAHIDIARPLSDEEASNGKDSQVFFRLNYGF